MTKVTAEPFYMPLFVNRNTNEKVRYFRHNTPPIVESPDQFFNCSSPKTESFNFNSMNDSEQIEEPP